MTFSHGEGVLINALAGVETAWVETIDYLADTWSVFVTQVKSMWNSTVGFLRKAWIKLKSLFDEDVNVEVEMAKIDKEMRTAEEADESKKQQAIAERMKKRSARKQQIEANRVQMQEGIKQQLEARRKAREGRDIDAEMSVIDQETEQKNQSVDAAAEDQFQQNESAGQSRQKTIDETTVGVQKSLDQMREEARAAREAARKAQQDRVGERDQQVAEAQAEFDAAVEVANAAKPPEPEVEKDLSAPVALPPQPKPPKPVDVQIPKVEVDGIDDPKLTPPKKKDLKLGLDRSAKDSLDQFSDGPEAVTEKTEAAGNFESRGLGLGAGASLIPVIEQNEHAAAPEIEANDGIDSEPVVPEVDGDEDNLGEVLFPDEPNASKDPNEQVPVPKDQHFTKQPDERNAAPEVTVDGDEFGEALFPYEPSLTKDPSEALPVHARQRFIKHPDAENPASKVTVDGDELGETLFPEQPSHTNKADEQSEEDWNELADALFPDEAKPTLDLDAVLASFAAIRDTIEEFDAALSQSVARLQMPQVSGDGLSDDVKRAIIQTAENTAQLVSQAKTGGFVFS